jgi:hypothetical protein
MPSGTARVIERPFDGQQLFEAAERHRLEGVVSKRKTAPYRSMSTSSISTACPKMAKLYIETLFARHFAGSGRFELPYQGKSRPRFASLDSN